MVAAAIFKISFLVITHQRIVRFQRNFVWGSRTACRQGLHDKTCKFLKSKMADGRQFENRTIAISQWKIVRFWWNLVHYIRYWTRWQSRDQKIEIFEIQDGGGRHLKNRFFGHCSSTDCPISGKYCMRKQNGILTRATEQKMQICKIQDGGRPPFWKSLNRHISVKNCLISMKFGTLQQMLNPIAVTWPKIEIFKIQDGGDRHLLKIAFLAITHRPIVRFRRILYEEAERHADKGHMTKTTHFKNPTGRTAAILKIVKLPYLSETIIGFWQNLVYYSI